MTKTEMQKLNEHAELIVELRTDMKNVKETLKSQDSKLDQILDKLDTKANKEEVVERDNAITAQVNKIDSKFWGLVVAVLMLALGLLADILIK